MRENRKKLLTEWLGESWPSDKTPLHKCIMRRTFAAPDDFFAVFDKLVELGEWEKFIQWFMKTKTELPFTTTTFGFHTDWLLSRTDTGEYRLCQLVAEWLKEAKVK